MSLGAGGLGSKKDRRCERCFTRKFTHAKRNLAGQELLHCRGGGAEQRHGFAVEVRLVVIATLDRQSDRGCDAAVRVSAACSRMTRAKNLGGTPTVRRKRRSSVPRWRRSGAPSRRPEVPAPRRRRAAQPSVRQADRVPARAARRAGSARLPAHAPVPSRSHDGVIEAGRQSLTKSRAASAARKRSLRLRQSTAHTF